MASKHYSQEQVSRSHWCKPKDHKYYLGLYGPWWTPFAWDKSHSCDLIEYSK